MKKRLLKTSAALIALTFVCGLLPPAVVKAEPKAAWPEFLLGDVDMDGDILSADARLALRASVSLEVYDKYSYAAAAADVDSDGSLTAADARSILRTAVGLEKLPQGIKESCDLFTVTVPAYWAGKYETEKEYNAIRFFYKPAKDVGHNGFLFSISANTDEEAKMYYLEAAVACLLEGAEPARCVMINTPSDYQAEPEQADEYYRMSKNIASIAGTLEPASWHAYPAAPDYSGLVGNFYGTQRADAPYDLCITSTSRNTLDGVLYYKTPASDDYDEFDVRFFLYGNEGLVMWEKNGVSYFGDVRIDGDLLEVKLNGPEGDWMGYDVPITFFPRQTYTFEGDPLTEAQESAWWQQLRGSWVDEAQNIILILRDTDGGEKNVVFGAVDAGADFNGTVEEPFFVSPGGMLRVTAGSPGYTDADGVYHDSVEIYLYLDTDALGSGILRWSLDREEWANGVFSEE